MKRSWIPAMVIPIAVICLFSLPAPDRVAAGEDQSKHPACAYCGMDRAKFAHSRALITYDDGTTAAICSLHCAAIDLSLKIDKNPVTVMVGDYNTKELIDAEAAHWVTGGDKMGVMTRRAKWAFGSEADALAFISAHGGSAANYSQAVRAAFEDMYEDLQMIRKKRQEMKRKKGA